MTEPLPTPDLDPAKPVVLVAEDEVLVRMLIADLVQDAGFRVIEAADARDAVRVLEARPDVYVLVTDVEMPPGPSGLDSAVEVRERWPFVEVTPPRGAPIRVGASRLFSRMSRSTRRRDVRRPQTRSLAQTFRCPSP